LITVVLLCGTVIIYEIARVETLYRSIMVTNSAFQESSVSRQQAATLIKREEYVKECNQAAALIQRTFRNHSEERASTFSSKSSFAILSSVLGDSSATTIALSFDNEDDRSISEDFTSYKDEGQFEDNTAPEKRSRKHFWGNLAAGAAGLIGVAVVSGMMGGAPVDEDDVAGVTGMVNSGGGGGGGATGATTSAQ
jgi:hypothetical protein